MNSERIIVMMEEENCTSYSVSFNYNFSPGMILTTIALGLINLTVLLGNSLVITAVIRNRKLRTVTNIYIVSLACADMLLALLVLPFSGTLEVLDFWPFGKRFCSMWLAIDVLLCTASILNLCAISMDRYLAVTKPIKYMSLMSKRKGKIIVFFVWILSFVISLPPLIGWNDENNGLEKEYEYKHTTHETFGNYTKPKLHNETICVKQYPQCELTPTRGYRICAALGSFYIPMFIMFFFYCQIYRAAIRTASSLRTGILLSKRSDESSNSKCMKMNTITLRVHRGGNCLSRSPSSSSGSHNRRTSYMINSNRDDKLSERNDIEVFHTRKQSISCLNNNKRSIAHNTSEPDLRNGVPRSKYHSADVVEESVSYYLGSSNSSRHMCPESPFQSRKSPPRCLKQSMRNGRQRSIVFINDGQPNQKLHIRKFLKETKAAKTVAIIVGAFIVCWFPFFTIYLIGAFCPDCVPHLAFSIIFWLGYCNSMLNPFIYALFSRDFRSAFRKILKCRKFYRSNMFTRSDPGPNNKRTFGMPIMESESFSDF